MHAEGTIVLSDMSKCEPAEALSRETAQGTWRLVDYETVDGRKGVMAYGVPDDNPGEIVLPLKTAGRYRIFLGMIYNALEDVQEKQNIGTMWCGGALSGHTSGQMMHHPADRQWFADEAEPYIRQAKRFYAAGADGFIVWDSERRHPYVSEWNILKYLCHRDQYDHLEKLAGETFNTIPLKTHRGISTVHSFRDG